jgi:hypothetical protein
MNEKFYRSSFKNRTEIGGYYGESGGAVFQLQRAGLKRGISAGFLWLIHRSMEPRPFRAFIQLNDAEIRNLPAESLYVTLLLVALFKKDGLPRVGRKVARCGQDYIPGSVGYLDAMP